MIECRTAWLTHIPLEWSKLGYDRHSGAANSVGSLSVGAYFAKSCIASSARTPPVIVIGANGAFAARSPLEIMIWSILAASCSTEAAKTKRLIRHHSIAPMHIAQGSPEV